MTNQYGVSLMISSQQIKAARAMLDWSQDALAHASGLSAATIHNLEKGYLSPRSSIEVRRVLEEEGFEFHGQTGIERYGDESRIFRGPNSTGLFLEDVLSTVKKRDGEITAIFKSKENFTRSLGIEKEQ